LARIAILLPDLRGGGVERVRLQLAAEFLKEGHQVEFILLRHTGALLDEVPAGASVYDLNCVRIRDLPLSLARYLRRYRPDALLAAMWPITGVACLVTRLASRTTRLVISEHNDLRHAPAVSKAEKFLLKLIGRQVYGRANHLITVSDGVAESVAQVSGTPRDSITTIYNPVRPQSRTTLSRNDSLVQWWKDSEISIIAVGSLKRQKGFDVLLDAMKGLRDRKVPARLLILGEGPEQHSLEAEIARLGLHSSVRLGGYKSDPYPYFREADLFVLSSRWEGLGNVIIEAMASGVPIVSTDCPSGPAELLEGGRYGILVPVDDAHALTNGIEEALRSPTNPTTLIERAAQFSPVLTASAYLRLLLN
jgi:glycosyltransferase involved in cell wall biosynthesis